MGPAAGLASSLSVSPYIPRTWPKLAQLSAQHVGQEVAFAGVLVWAAEVNTGRRLQLRVDTEVGSKRCNPLNVRNVPRKYGYQW